MTKCVKEFIKKRERDLKLLENITELSVTEQRKLFDKLHENQINDFQEFEESLSS